MTRSAKETIELFWKIQDDLLQRLYEQRQLAMEQPQEVTCGKKGALATCAAVP